MTRWDIDLDASGSDITSMTLGIPVPMSAMAKNRGRSCTLERSSRLRVRQEGDDGQRHE
jgi:hypothetical protein